MRGLLRLCMGIMLLAGFVMASLAGTPANGSGAPINSKLHPLFQQLLGGNEHQAKLCKQGNLYDAIVLTTNADAVRATGVAVNSVYPGFVTVQATAEQIATLAGVPEVSFVDPGVVNTIDNDLGVPETGATLVHSGVVNGTPYKGSGAIVVIYDTGIDWKHLDFRMPNDTTKSRILFIWDQTLTAGAGESAPTGFTYGVEYTKTQIENEIDGSPAGVVREHDVNGHGTHVCGTAAGNGNTYGGFYTGMAPQADIIFVKGGDNSFGETRMIDGLTYASAKASALGKPMVLNWSIGGHGGPHDGTRSYEQAVNAVVANPGKVVVISAGNEGATSIHISGTIAAGGTSTVSFSVPTFTATGGSDNDYFDFTAWFDGNANVSATATSPSSIAYTRAKDSYGDGPTITDGTISIYNQVSTLNSDRYVELWVHDANASYPPKTGTWTLALTNNGETPAQFDGWLSSKTVGGYTVTLTGGNTNETVSMPGTSAGAITVGAHQTKINWPSYTGGSYTFNGGIIGKIASFSSLGPTRDGRTKPEVTAPGFGVTSALSSTADTAGSYAYIVPGKKYWLMTGTSMAAPHVTGAVALLLGANPSYTAAQIKALLEATANADAYTGAVPNNTYGYGKLDVLEAMARTFSPSAILSSTTYQFDAGAVNNLAYLTGTTKYAVRFTPASGGLVSGLQFSLTTPTYRPAVGVGPLKCEIYSNNGGFPGALLGTTVTDPIAWLNAGSINHVNMVPANVAVTAGVDYHVVLSVTNAADTVIFRADTSTSGTRSSIYNGSAWSATTNNLRIRPIVTTGAGATGVETVEGTPETYALDQNYPNPFNPSTTIGFSIPAQKHVTVKIFNLLGQLVSTLVDEEMMAGKYKVEWNTKGLASGTYFYRLEAGSFMESRKMVLLK
jgi:minor extracellular serine protease Vpr